MKTYTIKPNEIDKKWILIDAEGVVLGRLATIIALRLRGKHKATFTPNVDMGDNVIVINAEKVQLSGRKKNKRHYWHTGYPGGIKSRTKGEILQGMHPERVVAQAVKRMLPGNKLSRKQMTNLRVYPGPAHPHEAQKPEVLDVKSMNPKNTRSDRGVRESRFNIGSTDRYSGIGHNSRYAGSAEFANKPAKFKWETRLERVLLDLATRESQKLDVTIDEYVSYLISLDLESLAQHKAFRILMRRLPYSLFSVLSDSLWEPKLAKSAAIALTATIFADKYRSKKALESHLLVADFEKVLSDSQIDSFVTTELWPGDKDKLSTIEARIWDRLPFELNNEVPQLAEADWLGNIDDFSVDVEGALVRGIRCLESDEIEDGQFGGVQVTFETGTDSPQDVRVDFFHRGQNFESKVIDPKLLAEINLH